MKKWSQINVNPSLVRRKLSVSWLKVPVMLRHHLLHEWLGWIDDVAHLHRTDQFEQNAFRISDLLLYEVIRDNQQASLGHNEHLLILFVPVIDSATAEAQVLDDISVIMNDGMGYPEKVGVISQIHDFYLIHWSFDIIIPWMSQGEVSVCILRCRHATISWGESVFLKRKSVSIRIIRQCIDVSRHFACDSHRDAVCKTNPDTG